MNKTNLWLGDYENDIDFTYEHRTEVYGSCTATLDDEMFVLGGNDQTRQVIKI